MRKYNNYYIPVVIYLILNSFCFFYLDNLYDIKLKLSFIIVNTTITILLLISFNYEMTYYEITLAMFYILFFVIAPIIQLKDGTFPIPFPIIGERVVFANIINSIFMISYIIFRFIKFGNKNKVIFPKYRMIMRKSTLKIIWIVVIIITIVFFPHLLKSILYGNIITFNNSVIDLIVKKFLFCIPITLGFYYISEYKNNRNKKNLYLLLISSVLIIFFKNPFNEKRNALGPIYLSFILFWFSNRLNVKRFLVLFTIVFTIGFPISSIITHSSIGIKDLLGDNSIFINQGIILDQFKQMHFDAFENLNVSIDYVNNYGIMRGRNIIGAFLFFIPRSIWISKPVSSGEIIGNYLINNYGFIFNNLSSPITAEGYLAFGILGVIIMAYFLARVSEVAFNNIKIGGYNEIVAWYIVTQLVFVLRGDLMNGIAYLLGTIVAIYIIPKYINIIRMK